MRQMHLWDMTWDRVDSCPKYMCVCIFFIKKLFHLSHIWALFKLISLFAKSSNDHILFDKKWPYYSYKQLFSMKTFRYFHVLSDPDPEHKRLGTRSYPDYIFSSVQVSSCLINTLCKNRSNIHKIISGIESATSYH